MGFIFLSVFLLLITGVLSLCIKNKFKYIFYLISVFLSSVMLINQSVLTLWKNQVYTDILVQNSIIGPITFATATVNSIFLIWLSLISFFAFKNFKNDIAKDNKSFLNYFIFVLIFISSICAITVTNSIFYVFSLLVFLTSILGFIFYNYFKPENKMNILKYLFMQIFSLGLVIFNVLLLANPTFSFNVYKNILINNPILSNTTLIIMFVVLFFQLVFAQKFLKNNLFNNGSTSFTEFIYTISNIIWIMNFIKFVYYIGNCAKIIPLLMFLAGIFLLFNLGKEKTLTCNTSNNSIIYIFMLISVLSAIVYNDENSIVFLVFGAIVFLLADIINNIFDSLNLKGKWWNLVTISILVLSRGLLYLGLFFFMFKSFPLPFVLVLAGLIVLIKYDIKLVRKNLIDKSLVESVK